MFTGTIVNNTTADLRWCEKEIRESLANDEMPEDLQDTFRFTKNENGSISIFWA